MATFEMSWQTARRIRLRSMGLDNARRLDGSVDAVAGGLCGVQAQDLAAAALGVRARSIGLTAADVDKAMFQKRAVARIWLMRETLHLVPAEDLHWMLSLFGPRNAAVSEKRAPGLGLSDSEAQKGLKTIRRLVEKHEAVTRAEIAAALKKAGLAIDPLNRVPMHLIRRAGSLGIVVEVAPKEGKQAFGALERWIAPAAPTERQQALQRLAQRYFTAFQPASEADFSAWSGLPVGELKKGMKPLSNHLVQVAVEGQKAWMLQGDLPASEGLPPASVRLLPAFDALILGYKKREFAVSGEDLNAIWPGGGVIRPIVTVDGRAAATWKVVKKRGDIEVLVQEFAKAGRLPKKELKSEVADVRRFLQGHVQTPV